MSENFDELKTKLWPLFRAGVSIQLITSKVDVSPDVIAKLELEYLEELLQHGESQRARLRDLIVRNTPKLYNELMKLAEQDVDIKLKFSACSRLLGMSQGFLKEDPMLVERERSIHKKNQEVGITDSLFNFATRNAATVYRQEQAEKAEVSPEELTDTLF